MYKNLIKIRSSQKPYQEQP